MTHDLFLFQTASFINLLLTFKTLYSSYFLDHQMLYLIWFGKEMDQYASERTMENLWQQKDLVIYMLIKILLTTHANTSSISLTGQQRLLLLH